MYVRNNKFVVINRESWRTCEKLAIACELAGLLCQSQLLQGLGLKTRHKITYIYFRSWVKTPRYQKVAKGFETSLFRILPTTDLRHRHTGWNAWCIRTRTKKLAGTSKKVFPKANPTNWAPPPTASASSAACWPVHHSKTFPSAILVDCWTSKWQQCLFGIEQPSGSQPLDWSHCAIM